VTVSVVGIGGSLRTDSQSERALRIALDGAERAGAKTTVITGADLVLPFYDPAEPERSPAAYRLVEELRNADGVVLVSPGYHGTVSGLVKNALDYLEELRGDSRPYLDGRAVGLIAVARGWQAAVSTLSTLRQIAHALRGWPTPLGLAINSTVTRFAEDGSTDDAAAAASVRMQAEQVVDFARRWSRPAALTPSE